MAGFMSLDNALSSLLSNRRGLDVVSQNIANASNENYSRQTAKLSANRPITLGTLSVGTGVSVTDITRARDDLLDSRLRQEIHNKGRFDQLQEVYREIENLLNEPSDEGIRGTLSNLVSSMQNLANEPENLGSRRDVVGQATTFADVLKRFHRQLRSIAGGPNSAAADQIDSTLQRVNNIGEQIASLNTEINAAEAAGSTPNDLLDQRLELVNELSEYIDTTVDKTGTTYRVNVAGYTLVQDAQSHQLRYGTRAGEDEQKILYDDNQESEIRPRSGRLKALNELREDLVPGLIDQLNDMAVQFVDRFNDMHRSGFGLQGQTRNNFWQELPTHDEGVFRLEGLGDLGGDIAERRAGFIDSPDTVLAGDDESEPKNFENDSGVFALDEDGDVIGAPTGELQINDSTINYDMSEDTIEDIIERINQDDNNASAYLSAENRLVIKGDQENDYQIDNMLDTGLLLDKANILTVGGTSRTAQNDIEETGDPLTATDELNGDVRIDAETASGTSLAQGTLEFEPSDSPDFSINYNADEDSLDDIVERINTAANENGANLSAEINENNQLHVYSSQSPPDQDAEPGTEINEEASFRINETSSRQLNEDVTAGADVEIEVDDSSNFREGDQVIISTNDGFGSEETAVVTEIVDDNTIRVDNLGENYDAGEAAIRRVEGRNNKRNLLNVLGMDRQFDSARAETENAFTGQLRRPPIPDQVGSLEVDRRIDNNPDLIAAGGGKDTTRDGIPDVPNGPGDGENMYDLSNLPARDIMEANSTSFDSYLSAMTSEVGNEAALIYREQRAAENLVNEITDRVRSVSGVSLDEEMTNMLRFQQGYQASARVISTVRQMTNELFNLV